jgi:GTPase KRas protein
MTVGRTYRIAVLGDFNVGKSALSHRFVEEKFVPETDPTMEEVYTKVQERWTVEVFDTRGDLGPSLDHGDDSAWIAQADGALIVYSITSQKSFENCSQWRDKFIKAKGNRNPILLLIGNKCDFEAERQVSVEEGHEFAKRNGMTFFETSAKESVHVDEAFTSILSQIQNSTEITQCTLQ